MILKPQGLLPTGASFTLNPGALWCSTTASPRIRGERKSIRFPLPLLLLLLLLLLLVLVLVLVLEKSDPHAGRNLVAATEFSELAKAPRHQVVATDASGFLM